MIFNERFFLKKICFTPSLLKVRAEQQLQGMELEEKEEEKDEKDIEKLLRNRS